MDGRSLEKAFQIRRFKNNVSGEIVSGQVVSCRCRSTGRAIVETPFPETLFVETHFLKRLNFKRFLFCLHFTRSPDGPISRFFIYLQSADQFLHISQSVLDAPAIELIDDVLGGAGIEVAGGAYLDCGCAG
jgi:hypothetical protein